jgi:hypothetical protein
VTVIVERETQFTLERTAWLESAGWTVRADGTCTHPRLHWPWPFWFALRLQTETFKGMQDPIHKSMREEVWP